MQSYFRRSVDYNDYLGTMLSCMEMCMSVQYYAADVRNRLDPSRHEESTMKKMPQPNVLFVNIGWAEKYDGEHPIQGNPQDIREQAVGLN